MASAHRPVADDGEVPDTLSANDVSLIDVRLDGHDLAALVRILGSRGDDDALFTALILSALNGHGDGDAVVSADDPLPISA